MKKIFSLILVFALVMVFTGCGPEILDENGPDDYSLATITDENIIKLDLGASSYSMSPGSEDADYMVKSTEFKGKEFSGVAEVYYANLLGKSDFTVNMDNISVKAGNFKAVVLLDDEIVYEFNNEDMFQTCELRDINGYVSVRLVGESADFKCWMNVW